LILGTLLVFRTNTSYDRWWEGRKLWGQLVNDSRNLAIKVQTCLRVNAEEKQRLARWLIDFAVALKRHLRRDTACESYLETVLSAGGGTESHRPAQIAAQIYDQIAAWRAADQIEAIDLLFLDQHAAALMNICGACERIQKSPISLSYRWFIRQSIAIYLLTLPWGLMQAFGWWTVPMVALIGYFMAGIEAIAEQIEDPFGITQDDLMLDDLCQTIETSVTEVLVAPQAVSTT
jgi:putative membrane protein